METAADLVARRLPRLLHIRGTSDPSISSERVSASFLHLWPNFLQDVLTARQSVDLSGRVSLTDSAEGERFAVGSELGLTGRVESNLCDPVSKALSVTHLSSVRFGDVQAVEEAFGLPDVVAFLLQNIDPNEQNTTLILVGELKTYWTLNLEVAQVTSQLERRRILEPHIGQLVSYMRQNCLKYGFLSTYKCTVFVRRVGDYRFELSTPISWQATGPSVRECLLGFLLIASADPEYHEPDDFDPSRLRQSAHPFFQASTRPSTYRVQEAPPTEGASEIPILSINSQTILFGDGGVSQSLVRCIRLIKGTPEKKAVFEVEWQGTKAIAKCWSPEAYESYGIESGVYQKLHQMRPDGYDVFASVLEHGEITCSSIFPKGYILVLSMVQGEQLSNVWDNLSLPVKNHVREQCRKAVRILRRIPIYSCDAGKHNILFSATTSRVTMLDFEMVGICSEEEITAIDAPELLSIFGEVAMREPVIGG